MPVQSIEPSTFKTMIASGPVIIQKRDGIKKTLLVKQGDKPINQLKWKFCGGRILPGLKLKNNATRRAKIEIGATIEIIKPLSPMVLWNETPEVTSNIPEVIMLIHYLAKINKEPKQGKQTLAMKWFDVNNLPEDCAANVKPLVKEAIA